MGVDLSGQADFVFDCCPDIFRFDFITYNSSYTTYMFYKNLQNLRKENKENPCFTLTTTSGPARGLMADLSPIGLHGSPGVEG
jgi:hypothetical protein